MYNFYDLSLAESSLFENYDSKGYEDLLIALGIADERVISKILGIADDNWTKSNLTHIKNYIEDEIQASYGGLFASMQKESVIAANIVYGASLGVTATVPTSTINDLINSKRQIQGYGFKELFTLTGDNHARQLKVVVSSGVAQGLTSSQIAKEFGIKSTQLSKGQIEGNIFTTIAESRDQGRYDAFKELEKMGVVNAYIYDATLDSGTTIYCRNHDQRVYKQNIAEIEQYIKVHFRCRSVFRPTQANKTRGSQFGEVENQSYKDWYSKQSNDFKQSTLTNRRYNAYLKGNYEVKGLHDLDKKTSFETIDKQLNTFNTK